jgi:hypothetical protein
MQNGGRVQAARPNDAACAKTLTGLGQAFPGHVQLPHGLTSAGPENDSRWSNPAASPPIRACESAPASLRHRARRLPLLGNGLPQRPPSTLRPPNTNTSWISGTGEPSPLSSAEPAALDTPARKFTRSNRVLHPSNSPIPLYHRHPPLRSTRGGRCGSTPALHESSQAAPPGPRTFLDVHS